MKKNMNTLDSVIRITTGTMLFVLFWFHTIGGIQLSDSKNVILGLFLLSIYLLLTGAGKYCPLYNLFGIGKK